MERGAHLVGSTPFDSASTAMRTALDRLGPRLRTLPDGETGERRNWIIHIIESLREHPDLEVRREGDWSDYDRTLTYRIRPGRHLDGRTLDFGHVLAFEESFPLFEKLRDEHDRPDLAFQVGIPGDFDMALFTLGPTGALLHRWPFTVATLREIHAIHRHGGGDVVFQLEIPAELVAVTSLPDPARPLVAAYLARGIAALATRSPEGTRFGLHLCLGDMNHRALGRMKDVRPLVLLANAIVRRWPEGRPLEFLHAPLAAGEDPPPREPAFYAPLSRLRLPSTTRFIAGLVHEDRTVAEQEELVRLIEGLLGRSVDVAASCGLGRRRLEDALATMERAAALCSAS
ncbi:MAG: hypothetical protein ACRDUY_15475 [Nitriliruptorales bacterium]